MNLKQGYKIVDSRKGGEVRKKSKIKDNGWRGFIDTPDDQKADYLWNYANEQEKLSGELNKMQKDFVDVFAKEKPGSVIYERDEDGGGINYYDTLRYAKWRDPDFKEVYAKNIQPFESDLNRRTADINMMNEHLGYPIGFESGHKPYWIKKQGIGDSARVNDMAIRDMAIYNKSGIEASAARKNSEFEAANVHLSSIFGLKQKAIDCFDTMEHIKNNGYESELNEELQNLRRETGVEPIFKDKVFNVTPEKGYGLNYNPYKDYLESGGIYSKHATNLQKSEFMKHYNFSEFANKPYDMLSWFFEDFFQWVDDMFGTDEVVQDSAKSQGENKSDKIADSNNAFKSMYEAWLQIDTALREMEQGKSYFEEKVYLDKGMEDMLGYIEEVEHLSPKSKTLYNAWTRMDTALREMEQGKTYFEEKIYLDRALMELMDGIVYLDRMAGKADA